MPTSVLVTGAQGFLGRAVSRILRETGYPVLELDCVSPASAAVATAVPCDITNKHELQHLMERTEVQAIVHLAAVLPTAARRDPLRATQVNVEGSLNLLQLAGQLGVRRFVFGSSLSIYGTCAPDAVVSETHRAAPEDLYGAAKLYVEQLGRAYAECTNLQFLSLRIGRVLGPGSASTTSAWRSQVFEWLQTREPADILVPYVGSERLLLVHVDDVARAMLTLLAAPRPRHAIYNAPCESWLVSDLKHELESLNPHLRVAMGDAPAHGNPRLLDSSRFSNEFRFQMLPLRQRLRSAAGH